MADKVEIFPVTGVGEVAPGSNVAQILLDAITAASLALKSGDVVVVTHKIVSKAEGRIVAASDEAAYRAVAEQEAAAVIRRRGDLIIAQTSHGFICANAGVDRSNIADGKVVLLPERPDRSAATIKARLEAATGATIAVIVSDTFGRPWRRGLTDVAIGIAGMSPLLDLRGTPDMYGRTLEVTEVAIVDEIAAAADLVMGKSSGVPAAIVRGIDWEPASGRATDLVRPAAEDMFR